MRGTYAKLRPANPGSTIPDTGMQELAELANAELESVLKTGSKLFDLFKKIGVPNR